MKPFFAVLSAVISIAHADLIPFTLAPFAGNGSCSTFAVDTISYSVTSSPTPLAAVFACNKPAYDALLPANLSDPATANLPPPLTELSCVGSNNMTCAKAFPSNRKLKPQIMCVLLKNWGTVPLNATLDVTWIAATDNSTANTTAPPPPPPPKSGAGRNIATAAAVVCGLVAISAALL